MIFVTGDIHGDPTCFSIDAFPEQKNMTKDDVVIILGDFGLVWNENEESKNEKYWLDWLEQKPFTTVFICGNHENFDRLYQYPVEEWNGGKVHKIRNHVLHLMRGEIFKIQDKTFFAFGGASSHDIRDGILEKDQKETIKRFRREYRAFRVNHVSWWQEELPSDEEMQNGRKNLEKIDYTVDFILTHSPDSSVLALMGYGCYKTDYLSDYLLDLKTQCQYTKWFFGHMHVDRAINDKEIALFEQIVRIV